MLPNINRIECINRTHHGKAADNITHHVKTHLKNPLQPSHVMALKWKPVALSPHTPQIRGALRSNSSGTTTDVVTVMGSITAEDRKKEEKERRDTSLFHYCSEHINRKRLTDSRCLCASMNFTNLEQSFQISFHSSDVLCSVSVWVWASWGRVRFPPLTQTGVRLLAYLAKGNDSHTLLAEWFSQTQVYTQRHTNAYTHREYYEWWNQCWLRRDLMTEKGPITKV